MSDCNECKATSESHPPMLARDGITPVSQFTFCLDGKVRCPTHWETYDRRSQRDARPPGERVAQSPLVPDNLSAARTLASRSRRAG